MRHRSLIAFAVVLIVPTALVAACGDKGDTGPAGPAGATGPGGPQGEAGLQGLPGELPDANGACTTPCHTFNGVVDQWRFSNHSHPQENQVGTGACGNCHALDGIQLRAAGSYFLPPDAGVVSNVPKGHISYLTTKNAAGEMSYAGAVTIGKIHCTTCHDFNAMNDPHVVGKYVPGSAPIRIPGGPNDEAYIEKTPDKDAGVTGQPVKMAAGNVCVMCHKSRKDVTWYVGTTNVISSAFWGPHEGPQADLFSAKGGFEYPSVQYGSSAHTSVAKGCVSCHMGPVAANGNTPDHTMQPTVAFCKTCHVQYQGNNFDVQGGETLVKDALSELEALLDAKGLLTRSETAPYVALQPDELADGQFQLDRARPGSGPNGTNQSLGALDAGALYNYFIVARGGAFGVHNPTYVKQLLWDSIKQIKGANPTSLPSRPQ